MCCCSQKRSWQLALGMTVLFAVAFIVGGIIGPELLQETIKSQAVEKVLMIPDTYDRWGQIPGEFGINITRNYAFYNWTNPRETVYFNQTPVFTQYSGNLYQEYQNFTNPSYIDLDNNTDQYEQVKYYFWEYSLPLNEPNQLVTTVNLGPFGFWYTGNHAPKEQLASNIIAILVEGLEAQIVATVTSIGMHYQKYPDFESVKTLLESCEINDEDLQQRMYSDPIYGLGSLFTMPTWVNAVFGGYNDGNTRILQDYFQLTNQQIQTLINKDVSDFAQGIYSVIGLVNNNYNCTDIDSLGRCDSKFLTALQWSTQNVSVHPPPGIPINPSVTSYNHSIFGFPEISYFMSEYLIPNFNLSKDDFSFTFTMEQSMRLLNHTPSEGSKYCTNWDTLLHQGNLQFLYNVGEQWEALNDTTNYTALEPIQTRFGLDNTTQAFVLYEYMKYMLEEFGKAESLQGDAGYLLMGLQTSEAMYKSWSTIKDNLQDDMISRIILYNITQDNLDCQDLMLNSLTGIDQNKAEEICNLSYVEQFNVDTMIFFINVCFRPLGNRWNEFIADAGVSKGQLEVFCTSPDPQTFGSYYTYSNQFMHDQYNCVQSETSCSDYEIALQQWGNSNITQNVPPFLTDELSTTLTLTDWNSTKYPVVFEYLAVINLLADNFDPKDLVGFDYYDALKTLNFDGLFNPVMVQYSFLYPKNNMIQNFTERFPGVPPYLLNTYLRYVMLEISFGGVAQQRRVHDLLWGYEDPFLVELKEKDPLQGGAPFIDPKLALSGGNMSYEQALESPVIMETGIPDSSKIRQYVEAYDSPYIRFNKTEFNGNETYAYFANPWAEDVELYGTDSAFNKPDLNDNSKIDTYVINIFFPSEIEAKPDEVPEHFGLDTIRFRQTYDGQANVTINPANAKYYTLKWNSMLNYTSVQSAPVFFSAIHFGMCDQPIIDAVEIYDTNGVKMTNTTADVTFLDLEPYSGVNVGSMLRLQLNYEMKQDQLFTTPHYAMLPLFFLERGTNLTDSQIDDVFGQLKLGVTTMKYLPVACYILAGFLFFVSLIAIIKLRKIRQIEKEDELRDPLFEDDYEGEGVRG